MEDNKTLNRATDIRMAAVLTSLASDLLFHHSDNDMEDGNFVACDNEEKKVDDQHVFTFHIEKVRQTYKTLEMMVDSKGGEA